MAAVVNTAEADTAHVMFLLLLSNRRIVMILLLCSLDLAGEPVARVLARTSLVQI